MKFSSKIKYTLLTLVALFLTACSGDDDIQLRGDAAVSVTFRPTIGETMPSRAIADGTEIDQITTIVFEREGNAPIEKIRTTETWTDVKANGVTLSLIQGHSYTVLFWAQNSASTAYKIGDGGQIAIDYSGYVDGRFGRMEQMDAFFATSDVVLTSNRHLSESVVLRRPFAQLNFADDKIKPQAGTHKVIATYSNLPTAINLLTGEVSVTETAAPVTFTFTDFPEETLVSDGEEYYYVASNYIATPASGSLSIFATIDLCDASGTTVTHHDFTTDETAIVVERNKRTNVIGAIVKEPEDIWDGKTMTEPKVDNQNRYIIAKTSDLAWLSQSGNTLETNRTFTVIADLDMGNHPLASVKLPAGSTVDGGEHTIKNVNATDGGLFGNVEDITIKNLKISDITASTSVTHVGSLVNTLRGNGNFTFVSVDNAKVVTNNGAAGGLIGYVVRKSEKDRNENLTVSISDCNISATTVSGTLSEGKFVGLLSGYDYNETLNFASTNTAEVTVTDYQSYYTDANKAAWIATNNYSQYDGWIGDETYCRATINCGGIRYIPHWDGSRKIEPLVENNVKLIYSAPDLASLQDSKDASITFKENVDLGKHLYIPIQTLANLNGENHTLYNLKIEMIHDGYTGAAFIRQGGGTYKDFTFDGAEITNRHNPEWGDGHSLAGNAYAATLIATVESQLNCENITCRNGKLYAVNKMGGLIGRTMYGTLNVKNCKVENYYIENYKPGLRDDGGFVTHGEVGGLIGFIYASNNDVIENCSVTNTQIKAYKYAGLGSLLPGRHVNQFIGDIRTPRAECRVYLTNNNVSDNSYLQDKDEYKYGGLFSKKICPIIGLVYYVYTSEKQGQVYFNGTKIFP